MKAESQLSTDGFALRTAAFYAVSCFLMGVQLPFFPVWLESKGFDAGQVGAILSATALMRIVSVTTATRAADHHFGIRRVIIAFAIATAAGFTFLGFVDKLWLIVSLTVLTAFCHTPAMALLDAYALRGLKARRRAYGPVRLWGSASFIVANLAAGLAFDIIRASDLIWLLSISAVATAMTAFWLMPLPAVATPSGQDQPAQRGLQTPVLPDRGMREEGVHLARRLNLLSPKDRWSLLVEGG